MSRQVISKYAVFASLPLAFSIGLPAHALGFGPIQVGSRLGQPLILEVPVHGILDDEEPPGCVKANISTLDGNAFFRAQTQFVVNGTTGSIQVRTGQLVQEPIIVVSLTLGCESPVRRDYQVLLDLPGTAEPAVPATFQAPAKAAVAEKPMHKQQAGNPGAAETSAIRSVQKPVITQQDKEPKAARAEAPQNAPLSTSASSFALRLSTTLSLPVNAIPAPVAPAGEAAAKDGPQASVTPARKELVLASSLTESSPSIAVDEKLLQKNQSLLGWALGLGAALLASVAALILVHRRMRRQNALMAAEVAAELDSPELSDHDDGEDDDWERVVPAVSRVAPQTMPHAAAQVESAKPDSSVPNWDEAEKEIPQPADNDSSFHHQLIDMVSLEEVDDLVQLAETWLELNQPEAVIKILGPMNKVDAPNSPLPWLYLLNAYRQLGDRQNFDDLYERVKQHFNVDVPDWGARDALEHPEAKAIADFPHIRDNIFAVWNTEDIVDYLESLLPDDRSGERQGFPLQVYQDILALIHLASDPKRPIASDGAIPDEVVEIVQRNAPADDARPDPFPRLSMEEMLPPIDTMPLVGKRA